MPKLKKRPPKEGRSKRAIGASILITIIRLICLFFLVLSVFTILTQYLLIIGGKIPSEIEKLALDYSISIFVGSAVTLVVYQTKVEDLIKKICLVEELPRVECTT